MNIGLSVNSIYQRNGQPKNFDGIGNYTSQLIHYLSIENIKIHEIYFKNIKDLLISNKTDEKRLIANSALYSLLPGNYYHNLKSKIDILHITNYLVPRIKHLPTISTIHDSVMLKHPEWLAGPLRYLKGPILKKLNRHVDFVITCSQASIADIVNDWQIPENKIGVTHYGLSPIWRQSIDVNLQQSTLAKLNINQPFFLSVGTLQPRKNFERIINAYLSLPKNITEHFNLVIVGKSHPTLTPGSLLNKIRKLEDQKRLIWLKYLSLSELRCLYQNAYLLLFPSLEEGFGFPVLEAFASKTPVITSNSSSTAEIAGSAGYLVDPYSEPAIAEAIQHLAENHSLREELIQKGQDRVQLFTWEQCANKTIGIYKQFL